MYKTKKENILMMLLFIINEELKNFHINEIDNRYSKVGARFVIGNDLKKNRIAERIVYWNAFTKKSFDYILNTPSKGVLKTRLKLFKKTPDCTDVIYEQIVKALRQYLEVCNLGSSEAFIELVNTTSSNKDLTFDWLKGNSQLKALFTKLKHYGLIESNSSLKSFKNVFGGGLLSDIQQIKFMATNSLTIYLFDKLNEEKIIRYTSKPNKVIETITGIKNVAQTRDKFLNSKTGLPKGHKNVNLILSDI